MKLPIFSRIVAATYVAVSLFAPLPSFAAGRTYVQDTAINLTGVNVIIKTGSEADSFTTSGNSLTVTVGANEAFIVRSPSENPVGLENTSGLPSCNVLQNRENQLIINGPRTTTITPSSSLCSTLNNASNNTTLLSMTQPNGGETLAAGKPYEVFWQVNGGTPASVRLRLSTDGGVTFPLSISTDMITPGYYRWTVPMITTTTHARIKVEAIDAGGISAMGMSVADFTINGTEPAVVAPTTPSVTPVGGYDPAIVMTAAASIDANQSFAAPASSSGAETCLSGSRIKGATNTAVYYCGTDHKRHPFPNQRIHDSWYTGFAGVITLTDAQLAAAPLGANVTYRPGVRLVKIQTDPKVYAVAANSTLRWVPDEWTAKKLYGNDWSKKVDDVPDSFFTNYTIGDPISTQ